MRTDATRAGGDAIALVGRDDEQLRINDHLTAIETGFATLLLEGEPGIGKTALWGSGVESAQARGFRVLVARPAEAEASLSFAALGDLLADTADEIGDLPLPQRHALRVALLLEEADRAADARAVPVALLGLLRRLARERPLLLAVDDLQWVDPASARALAFALRRLAGEPAGLLGATRPVVSTLELEFPARLVLGPLGLSALDRIVRRAYETQLSRPVLRRLETISGGNPFYALELAGTLLRRDDAGVTPAAIAVPERLTDLVHERLSGLPEAARDVLLAVSVLSSPAPDVVTAAVPHPAALDAAMAAGLVTVQGDRVRLHHPLLGSVAYAAAPDDVRRDLHRRLASIVPGREERARHLASAASGPSAVVADEVESAARGARARGAAETAAELAELAVELTPSADLDAGVRRRALAGDCYFAAGDAQRAEILLETVVEAVPPGPLRARSLWRLASVKAAASGPAAAVPLFHRALEEAGDDYRLQAQIHDRLATWVWISQGARAAEPHTLALLKLAERAGDPGLLARALGAQLTIELAQGRGLDQKRYERMLELEREAPTTSVEVPGSTLHHQLLAWSSGYEESRSRIAAFLEQARERSEASQILPLWCSGYVDVMTAHWEDALEATARGLELVEQVGRDALVPGYLSLRALARAHLGDADLASADAERAIELGKRHAQEIHVISAQVALALLDLSQGATARARDRYAEAAGLNERRGDNGVGEWWLGDELEARVAEGDLVEAERRLAAYESDGQSPRGARHLATTERIHALLAHERGETGIAFDHFDAALKHHDCFDDPYQRGRTLLARGAIQRRLTRRVEARESLTAALEQFEQVGARLWQARARDEIGRLGGRPSRPRELSGTEEQIARLVAAGKSNAEVARLLHISPRTVEWNLSKIYRKLDVTSRTHLAAKLASRIS